jgi:hypothetical protein
VATSEDSRPSASACSLTLRALGGQVPPGQLTSGAAKGRRAPPPAASRANSVLVLIIFVMATGRFAATREAFDQREGVRVATDEAGPVRCGPGSVVVLAVEVWTGGRCRSSPRSRWGGEPVSQILSGEVVQRCRGHGSGGRSNVVSLIVDSLQELRQRWPVALSEDSLVELAGQGCPPLLR